MINDEPNGIPPHPEGKEARPSLNGGELPILAYAKEIKETAQQHDALIIVGETGSGKTTQIPLLLREVTDPDQKIAITQPRRVAARSVARYVAEQVGCRVGEEVGYRVRFEDQTTEGTRVNFMTDGILLRKMQQDPLLREYAVVMVDEVHERSLNIDLTLGLLKRLQEKRREEGLPPIKIVVTSATLEKEKLAAYFDSAPVVEVPGRLHPVEVHYETDIPWNFKYTQAAAEKAKAIVQTGKAGDVLIFMPGAEEIASTIRSLEELALPDVVIFPLHGTLSPEEQDRIFDTRDKRRKIIVSTNVAETSVTVPGVRHVIDSGLIKQIEFDPHTGIEALAARRHAKSGCVQRAGRAGRVAPGDCHRLYTEDDFNQRRDFQLPEIQRSNLAHVVLTMKQIGIDNVESFDFIDPPQREALIQAISTLKILGALDEDENMTETGRVMAELPLEPHIARMVIEAEKHGCVEQICTIASFMGARSVFVRPRDNQWEADAAHEQFEVRPTREQPDLPYSDFLTLLNVWKHYEANKFNDHWARTNFLNAKALNEIRDIRYQLFRALNRNGIRAAENQDPQAIGKAIAAGLIQNLMEQYGGWTYRRVADNSSGFEIHPSSSLNNQDRRFLVSSNPRQGPPDRRGRTHIWLDQCQEVKSEWIREIAPQLIREEVRAAAYNPSTDTVVQPVELYLRGSSSSYAAEQRGVTGPEAVAAFAQGLVNNPEVNPFYEQNAATLARIKDLYIRSSGTTVPPLSAHQIAQIYQERLGTIATRQALEQAVAEGKVDLTIHMTDYISDEQQAEILRDNPDTVQLGGSAYPIRYTENTWGSERYSARVAVPVEQIFTIAQTLALPSGKQLYIEVIGKNQYGSRTLAEGTDLSRLQQEGRNALIKQQWDHWRYRQPAEKLSTRIGSIDLASPLPELPEPLEYGTDPQTGQPLLAYPAVTAESSYYSSTYTYSIRYYATKAEAQAAQQNVEQIREQAVAQQRAEQERLELLPQVRALEEQVIEAINNVDVHGGYEAYGLTYSDWYQLREQRRQASYQIERNPKDSRETLLYIQQILQDGKQRAIEQARREEEKREARRKAEEAAQERRNQEASSYQEPRYPDYDEYEDEGPQAETEEETVMGELLKGLLAKQNQPTQTERTEPQPTPSPTPPRPPEQRTAQTEQPTGTLLEQVEAKDTESLAAEIEDIVAKGNRPRKLAFDRAVIMRRGFDAIAQAHISPEDIPMTLEQLRAASNAITDPSKDEEKQQIIQLARTVERVQLVLQASQSELVRSYLGEQDPENLQRFQTIFLNMLEGRKHLPKDKELSELIEAAIEQV